MNDITALPQRLKERAEQAKRLGAKNPRFTADEVLALVEALEKAQQAANINNQWKPDVCPITGRRFFMWIGHSELGYVPTYGGPFDSYTIPSRDSDGEFCCERFDHDLGDWREGECSGLYLIDDDEQCRVHELEQRIAELESRTVTVKLPDPLMPAQHNSGELFMTPDNVIHGGYLNRDDVLRILAAAGIQVIEGEPK